MVILCKLIILFSTSVYKLIGLCTPQLPPKWTSMISTILANSFIQTQKQKRLSRFLQSVAKDIFVHLMCFKRPVSDLSQPMNNGKSFGHDKSVMHLSVWNLFSKTHIFAARFHVVRLFCHILPAPAG